MTNNDLNEADLESYILGELPGANAEMFDELSITSGEFSDALGAVEAELTDSYVNNELSPEKRELFERNVLRTNAGRENLKFATAFRDFSDLHPVMPSAVTGPVDRQVTLIRPLNWYLRWGLGTAVAAAVLIGGWFYFNSANGNEELAKEIVTPLPTNDTVSNNASPAISEIPSDPSNTGGSNLSNSNRIGNSTVGNMENPKHSNAERPTTIPEVFAFTLSPQLRSGAQTPELKIPANAERALIRLELEPADFSTFRITLKDRSNRQVWNANNLRPKGSNTRRFVTATLPARLLREGTYIFTVSGMQAGSSPEPLSDYSFRVVK